MKRGIDVSEWQGLIDWKKVKESKEVDFAILRVGVNENYDEYLLQNLAGCENNNIPWGAYWYIYPYSLTSMATQLEMLVNFLSMLKKPPAYPIYLDIEEEGIFAFDVEKILTEFCEKIEKAGFYAGIYCNYSFYKRISASIWKRFDRWLAWPNSSPVPVASNIVQVSWKGKVPGISTDVDINECYKDYPTIIKGMKKE